GGMPPPMMQQGGGAVMAGGGGYGGGAVSLENGVWGPLGYSILFLIGLFLLIPAPPGAAMFYRWLIPHVQVPGRPNLEFTGQVGDIWWVFVLLGLCSYSGATGYTSIQLILIPLQAYLSWMTVRWIASNIASNGAKLPIEFKGSVLGYIGWYLLLMVSFITIIGWAWGTTAWIPWNCRNVAGTHRQIPFHGTGFP